MGSANGISVDYIKPIVNDISNFNYNLIIKKSDDGSNYYYDEVNLQITLNTKQIMQHI